MSDTVDDIVVFLYPDGTPFSNDPRWNDRETREAWQARQDGVEDEQIAADGEDEDYESWTNDELRTELASRKLSVDGKKEVLIKRLEDDDAKEA